jgi:hypothetical protein
VATRSRLPLPGAGRQPSFTNITRSKPTAETPKPVVQAFQRERSFVETNFVQTPKGSGVTQILPDPKSVLFIGPFSPHCSFFVTYF